MKLAFLDTSGLVGIVNADDQWHSMAEQVWSKLLESTTQIVTTSLVLIELADGLSRLRHREMAIRTIDALRQWEFITIVQTDISLESTAWQLFRERTDKEWSMTDCVSMTVMNQQGIQDIFTADKHFKQAGFNILLQEKQ